MAIGRCSRGHRAVAAGNFGKKTEITEERTKKAGVHLSLGQASAAPCLCEKVSVFSEKSVPQVAQGRMAPRNNQANTQVAFIESLADRIIF